MTRLFKFVLLTLGVLGLVSAEEPTCSKVCEAVLKEVLKTENPDTFKHVSARVCPLWHGQNGPQRKKFCAALAMSQEFFGAAVDFNKLPGRMCGDVRIHKSDTSLIIDLPNLDQHAPGCQCIV